MKLRSAITELNKKIKMTENEFLDQLTSINEKISDEIYEIDTSEYDDYDLVNEYNKILQKYKVPLEVQKIKIDKYGGVQWMTVANL